jgi:hypothetical protein
MKKHIQLISGILSLLLLFAFVIRPDLNYTQPLKQISRKAPLMDANLYNLYIDINSVKPQLKILCDDMDIQTNNKYVNKIVFQFFYQNGIITLAVYGGSKSHQGFDSKFNLILEHANCTTYSIDSKNVYLGDQEIVKQDVNWATLKSWIKDGSNKYIVFKPTLADGSANDSGIGGLTITYEIYPAKNEAEICNEPPKFFNSLETNPSPPHGGN